MKSRVFGLYALLLALNLGAWAWALLAFHRLPLLLGTALLAYSLGLRHAVDADHIAAIDNVTRKLMQAGQRPLTVGLWFSLGHSTVVLAGSMLIASAAVALQHRLGGLQAWGSLIGTLVSAFFLFAIAAVNWIVFRSVSAAFQRVRRGEPYIDEDFNLLLAGCGLLARLFRPVFGLVRRGRHMYPVGFLFGLGFDTATEIGVLGLSALEAAKGLPLGSILALPALFTTGMALIDSTDNVLMLGAYGWAFTKPVRKLYYNLTITCVSVMVALAVGGLEALGLLAGELHLRGLFWTAVTRLNANFGALGYAIIALFALSWLISAAIYKWRRFDDLELNA